MERRPCVYLLASDRNGTLYCGVTSDLVRRVWQHRTHAADGLSSRYDVTRLWYEVHQTMESAIVREKRIKKWTRAWKLRLIDDMNPSWRDLWSDIAETLPKANVQPVLAPRRTPKIRAPGDERPGIFPLCAPGTGRFGSGTR